jgi:hypothetical protein
MKGIAWYNKGQRKLVKAATLGVRALLYCFLAPHAYE